MGWHAIIDCNDVDMELCVSDKYLSETIEEVAVDIGADVISKGRYRFGQHSPDGCTAFVMLDESHISIHTYAKKQKMAIDIFISGNLDKCEKAVSLLVNKLNISQKEIKIIERFI